MLAISMTNARSSGEIVFPLVSRFLFPGRGRLLQGGGDHIDDFIGFIDREGNLPHGVGVGGVDEEVELSIARSDFDVVILSELLNGAKIQTAREARLLGVPEKSSADSSEGFRRVGVAMKVKVLFVQCRHGGTLLSTRFEVLIPVGGLSCRLHCGGGRYGGAGEASKEQGKKGGEGQCSAHG